MFFTNFVGKSIALLVGSVVFPVAIFYLSPRSIKRKVFTRMFKAFREQKPDMNSDYQSGVLPHSEIHSISENVWNVSGSLPQPGPKFNRNMVIYRVPDTRTLIIHSPVCLNQQAKEHLESLGDPLVVIVPCAFHRLDASRYKAEYPNALFVCPRKAREWVEKCVQVDDVCEEIFSEGNKYQVECLHPEGVGKLFDELMYIFNVSTLVVCDFFFNLGVNQIDTVAQLNGTNKGFGISNLGLIMSENIALLRQWVETKLIPRKDLKAIVVAHGEVLLGRDKIEHELNRALSRIQ